MAFININSLRNNFDLFTTTGSEYIMISETNFDDTLPYVLIIKDFTTA